MRLSFIVIGLVVIALGWAVPAYVGAPFRVGCPPGATCNTNIGNLVGYVTNSSSSQGIVGASVVLSNSGIAAYTTSTTTGGYYKFGAITAGGYTISISATGYKSLQSTTTVSPGTTATFSAQLAPLASSGGSNGTGCTPLPTGGCTVPPPPPGIQPPPQPPVNFTGNATTNTTQFPGPQGVPGNPSYFALVFSSIGVVLVVVGVFSRGRRG